jgi:cell division protein ZapA
MENRVIVSICGEEYTLVAEEAPSYMQKVGGYVDTKLSELIEAAKVGRTDAAVLTAVNITDELFKERESAEALRTQVKQYADDAAQAKNEASDLKREVFKLQKAGESSESLRAQVKQYADEAGELRRENDKLKKEQESAGELRAQVKQYADEAAELRREADRLKKELEAAGGLRAQIKQYADEASKARNEASDLRREVVRLQNEIDRFRGQKG